MLTSPSRQPVRGVVMAGGLEGGEQVGNERDRMAAPIHRGRDRLGAEIRPAAPRRELEERGDGAELVRRVADGDAAASSSSRSHATSRSWPATRRAHTLARYSARCSVAIAAGEHLHLMQAGARRRQTLGATIACFGGGAEAP